MKNPLKRQARVDPNDLDRQTREIQEKLEREGPRMNAIASFLEWRGERNGFGEDFDITVKQPRKA